MGAHAPTAAQRPTTTHPPGSSHAPVQRVSAAAQHQAASPAAAGAVPQASDVVRRFYDAYNARDLATISTLIADDISYQ